VTLVWTPGYDDGSTYTPGKLVLSKIQLDARDADANAYMAAVEAADGEPLELGVRLAITDFVLGCKSDGIWTAIKASCILAGARTLTGALVPLVGAAPTNNNFVSGDYNRKTGLVGDGSTKYLNSNLFVNALSATSHALFAYGAITGNTGDKTLMGYIESAQSSLLSLDEWANYVNSRAFRSANFTSGEFPVSALATSATCIIGSRTSSTSATLFVDGVSTANSTSASLTLSAAPLYVFAMNSNNVAGAFTLSRIQVYGIFNPGLTSTQAAALRANTIALINAFAAAIP
jgi:hypothetical protein